MKVKAYAKVNLYLEIVGKRADGYHLLKSVMQEVGLYDEITLTPSSEDHFSSSDASLEGDDNLIMKALRSFRKERDIGPLHIHLEKNIPMGAGLGGGSSDAAKTLLALNTMVEKPLNLDDLKKIALTLGADVPFFIEGGATRVEGIGEILTPLEGKKGRDLLLIKPPCHLSTPKVYGELRKEDYEGESDYEAFIASYESDGPLLLRNDLAHPAMRLCPEITTILSELEGQGFQAMVTGSGSCIFCLLEGKDIPQGLEDYWQYKTELR